MRREKAGYMPRSEKKWSAVAPKNIIIYNELNSAAVVTISNASFGRQPLLIDVTPGLGAGKQYTFLPAR